MYNGRLKAKHCAYVNIQLVTNDVALIYMIEVVTPEMYKRKFFTLFPDCHIIRLKRKLNLSDAYF